MTNLKTQHIDKLTATKLTSAIQGIIIDLVEEGYSEVEIKKYLEEKHKNSLIFLKEYVALQ